MSAALLLMALLQLPPAGAAAPPSNDPGPPPPVPAAVPFDAGAPPPPPAVPPPAPAAVPNALPPPTPVPAAPHASPAPAPAAVPAPAPHPVAPVEPYEPAPAIVEPARPDVSPRPPVYVEPRTPFAPPPSIATADAGTPEPWPGKNKLQVRGGVEAGFTSWPSGNPQDLFFDVRPLLSISAGEDFGIDLGATFHLRVFDDPPLDRSRDIGGVLRRADWDEPSDFGQILHFLRIGKIDSIFWLRAGAVTLKTVGEGHLINRYSNQDNPEYHPAAVGAALQVGPVRAEAFVSDVLGARLFSGLVGLELGRLIATDPKWFDRFWFTFEAAHDVGQAGGVAPQATLLELDFTAALYRSKSARVQLLTGAGVRANASADFGALLGLSADADLEGFLIAGKLEARKQAGGYRQGFFGPQYEISRFIGSGFSGVPIADEKLPDAFSFYGELRVGTRGFLVVEAALEHFTWGRTDLDVSLNAEMFGSRFTAAARFTAVALGVLPRYAISADARFRLFRSLYLYGAGGTLFFPQVNGTLERGVFVSAGAGADFELLF